MIGSPDLIGGLEDFERFRVYDPSQKTIVFWGERFHVQPIVTEIERIYLLAVAEVSKP